MTSHGLVTSVALLVASFNVMPTTPMPLSKYLNNSIVSNEIHRKSDENPGRLYVFYDALSPASRKFFKEQLDRVWNDFAPALDVQLLAYGKIKREWKNKKWTNYTCLRGPEECRAAMIHGCIKYNRELNNLVTNNLLRCLMRLPNTDDVESCGKELGLPGVASKTEACLAAGTGELKLGLMGDFHRELFKTTPLQHTPALVFDNVYDPSIQQAALADLRGLLCSKYPNKMKEKRCAAPAILGGTTEETSNSRTQKPVLKIFYDVLDPQSKTFFLEQLDRVYDQFSSLVEFDLIGFGKIKRIRDKKVQWKFICPLGEEQCHIAKLHACIKMNRELQDSAVNDVIRCLMRLDNPGDIQVCEKELEMSELAERAEECGEAAAGRLHLALLGGFKALYLGESPLENTPSLVINRKYNASIQEQFRNDFKSVICSTLSDKPDVCDDSFGDMTPPPDTDVTPPPEEISVTTGDSAFHIFRELLEHCNLLD